MYLSFFLKQLILPLLRLSSVALYAKVKLAAIFSDNMVLQRDKPVYTWGEANAGSFVTAQPDLINMERWPALLFRIHNFKTTKG